MIKRQGSKLLSYFIKLARLCPPYLLFEIDSFFIFAFTSFLCRYLIALTSVVIYFQLKFFSSLYL